MRRRRRRRGRRSACDRPAAARRCTSAARAPGRLAARGAGALGGCAVPRRSTARSPRAGSSASSPAGSLRAATSRSLPRSSRSRTRLARVNEAMRSTSCRCLGRPRRASWRRSGRRASSRSPPRGRVRPARAARCARSRRPAAHASRLLAHRTRHDCLSLRRRDRAPPDEGAGSSLQAHRRRGDAAGRQAAARRCDPPRAGRFRRIGVRRRRGFDARPPFRLAQPLDRAPASSGAGRRAAHGCRRAGAPAPAGWRAA